MKVFWRSLGVVSFLFLLGMLLSQSETSETIEINAPVEAVWDYLADNRNAAEWSIFFKSIKTLSSVGEGEILGAVRRCYRGEDEKQAYWDEVTIESRPYEYRKIITYNLVGFRQPEAKSAQFEVHNRFERLGEKSTRLTFASVNLAPGGLVAIYFKLRNSEAKDTLLKNLSNLKAAVEARYENREYVRPYPYLPVGSHPMD